MRKISLLLLLIPLVFCDETTTVASKMVENTVTKAENDKRMKDIVDSVDKALEQPDRFLDVRQLIKEAINVMRTVPAPNALTQIPQDIQRQRQQEQLKAYYAQQQRQNYPVRAYGSATYRPNQQVVSSYGPRPAQPQPDAISQIGRLFATPTSNDMEKLFHLPADIIQRLASDAGYIEPQPDMDKYKRVDSDTGFGGGSPGSFSLSGDSGQGLDSFIASLQQQNQQVYTTTPEPVTAIPIAAPPKIVMRSIQQGNRIVQIPVLAVPQPNGQTRYVQYDKLSDLSEALSKAVSTGQLPIPREQQVPQTVPQNLPLPQGTFNFNFPENIQVEAPTSPAPVKTRTESSSSNGFVQQFDVDNSESRDSEVSDSRDSGETTTTSAPSTRVTPTPLSANNEPSADLLSLLQKLKMAQENATEINNFAQAGQAFGTNNNANYQRLAEINRILKSLDNEFPKPQSMDMLPSTSSTAPNTTPISTTLTQPTSMSSSSKTNEVHLNGRRYKLVEVDSSETSEMPSTTMETTTIQMTTTMAPKLETIQPKVLSLKSAAIELSRNLYRTSKSRQPTIRKALNVIETTEHHVTQESTTTTTPAPAPQRRTYSLKELEEIIQSGRKQADDSSEEHQTRPLTSQQLLSAGRQVTPPPTRAQLLRQQYALEKAKWAEMTRKAFTSGDRDSKSLFHQQCESVVQFASRFNVADVATFAKDNCEFIENFIPTMKCNELADFFNECRQKLRL